MRDVKFEKSHLVKGLGSIPAERICEFLEIAPLVGKAISIAMKIAIDCYNALERQKKYEKFLDRVSNLGNYGTVDEIVRDFVHRATFAYKEDVLDENLDRTIRQKLNRVKRRVVSGKEERYQKSLTPSTGMRL